MSKKDPTPINARLHMSMNDFSFFSRDVGAVIDEIKIILAQGHTLTLNMTQSTSLSTDLHIINDSFNRDYEIHYRFKKDQYEKSQVVVILQMEDEV